MMRLYFMPFACSLASRIALEEAGLQAEFVLANPADDSLPDGRSFREVTPLGLVPVLELDDGQILTEGPAILQYIADRAPESGLAPPNGTGERYDLQKWLNFISTELHKYIFTTLLNSKAPAEVRDCTLANLKPRFEHLSRHLESRQFLLDSFSIADAYLLAVLNWCESAGVDIAAWPVIEAYRKRMRQRPSIASAMKIEWPLLKAA